MTPHDPHKKGRRRPWPSRCPMSSDAAAVLLLTVDQAATKLACSRRKIFDLLARGKLPRVKLGTRSVRIPLAALERFAAGAL